jgi:hypothetical protein
MDTSQHRSTSMTMAGNNKEAAPCMLDNHLSVVVSVSGNLVRGLWQKVK